MAEPEPTDAAGWHARARAQLAAGRLTAALADLDHAIALGPDDSALYRARALLRRQLGQADGALADLDHAIVLALNDLDAWRDLGR